MLTIDQTIRQALAELLEAENITLAAPLQHDTVLLSTGLDSLGFASLVIELEMRLGFDPFVLSPDPVYPRTYGEFLALYEKYASHRVEQAQ
jgi:acyl carrier protein